MSRASIEGARPQTALWTVPGRVPGRVPAPVAAGLPARRLDLDPGDGVRIVRLRTPPAPCVVPGLPAPVFDAFGWCESDELEWRRPDGRWDGAPRVDGSDPARMVFVLRAPCDFLPRELARLHAFGLGLADEEALAPWGIDAATDELFARRIPPGSLLWLAADNLNALFWGLHDWAHFHHHGPFTEPAWTELQCDATALAWLRLNLERVPLATASWEELRSNVEDLSRSRFSSERKAFDSGVLSSERLARAARAMGAPCRGAAAGATAVAAR